MECLTSKVVKSIRLNIKGLPGFCRLVIYELLEYCNYETGTISIGTLDEIAQAFYVAPSPGRKKEIINGDTIRNAFRTIKKAKPDAFKFTSVNQRIIIEMPFIRKLYQEFYSQPREVAGVDHSDQNTPTTIATYDESCVFMDDLGREDVTDLAAASFSHIDITKNKNKQNKLTGHGELKRIKKSISPDFSPSPETIDAALAKGFTNVLNPEELQKFINHNLTHNTQWADFNPVFLKWLERAQAYNETKQSIHKSTTSRSKRSECFHQNNTYPAFMREVLEANKDAWVPNQRCSAFTDDGESHNHETYEMAMDSTNEHIWATVY